QHKRGAFLFVILRSKKYARRIEWCGMNFGAAAPSAPCHPELVEGSRDQRITWIATWKFIGSEAKDLQLFCLNRLKVPPGRQVEGSAHRCSSFCRNPRSARWRS